MVSRWTAIKGTLLAVAFASVSPLVAEDPTPVTPDPATPDAVIGATISYRNEIVPVLTRAGCNLGACHGAQTGKAELALSLRGEDPIRDHAALVKSFVNLGAPEKSFLLRKATLDVAHEGGKRFEDESESYQLVRQWIAEGAVLDLPGEPQVVSLTATPDERVLFAPEESLRIEVTAHFSDGSTRNVNRWAIYEPSTLHLEVDTDGNVKSLRPGETTVNIRYLGLQAPVKLAFVPERPGFVWSNPPAHNFIDETLYAKWQTLRINPSGVCDDATFIRRASLDLTGIIPGEAEAKTFVADPDPAKRAKLIDALLERREFADFWAMKWADLLRLEEKVLDSKGVEKFHSWIRKSIAENKPVDHFVREIVTALGSTYEVAPANYYRALRSPEDRAEAIAQIFLGTRMNCAKCHNHPFEKWTMDQYYEFAAVFDGMDYDIKENNRFDKNDKNNFVGEQVVKLVEKRNLKDPRTGNSPPPKLLGETATLPSDKKRLDALGKWMTSAEHPLFAQVQANRIWFHLMGRGIVEPIDDFRATNPPVNPALLEALTADFVESGFDLRHAIRTICASRAYQLDSLPNETNADDEINFARTLPRRLGAEQLLDSVHLAMGSMATFEGYEKAMRASQIPGVQAIYRPKSPTAGDTFVHLFGKPPRLTNSDTERTYNTSLAQVFELTSGRTLNELLTNPKNTLATLIEGQEDDADLIKTLYWTVLTREPTAYELTSTGEYLGKAEKRREALEDITWSLLNAKEFLLRR